MKDLDITKGINKTAIEKQVRTLTEQVINGEVAPIKAWVGLTAFEKIVSETKRNIEQEAISDSEKYNSKTFDAFGAECSIRETGIKYDYSISAKWRELQEKIEELREEQKIIEKQMQLACEKAPFIDQISGEIITAICKSSKTSLCVKIK